MDLPASISTGRVVGQFVVGVIDGPDPNDEPDLIPARGTIAFTPSIPYLPVPVASPNPFTVLETTKIGVLDALGYLCTPDPMNPSKPGARGVRLISTDNKDASVKDWTWIATPQFENVNGTVLRDVIKPTPFHLPGNETRDLTTVVKVPASQGIGTDQALALAEAAQLAAQSAASNVEGALAAAKSAQASARAAAADLAELGSDLAGAVEREITTEWTAANSSLRELATNAAITATEPLADVVAAIPAKITSAVDPKLDKVDAAESFAVKPDNGGKPVGKGELMANVRDFGAKGDGISSDSAGVQAAINWLDANGGGDLLIPRGADYGDYWIREAVKLCSNIRIVGSGGPVLRKKVGDPTYAIFAGLSNGRRGYGSGASNIEVSGIEFRGTFGTATTPERSACAFALHHSENVLVRNCNFIEMQITGHVFDLNGCRNITIRNNVFRGIKKSDGPGVAECIQLDQSKNGSLSFADAPGSYDGLLTCDVLIANNKFLPYVAADGTWYPAPNIGGNHTVRQGAYYENIKILDNYVEDPIRGTGDRWVGNIHLMGTRNVEILRNTWVSTRGELAKLISVMSVDVGNDLASDPEVATAVSAIPAQGCVDVRIEGNIVRGFSGVANPVEYLIHIWGIEGKGDVMSGIGVTDNTFRDNYAAATGGTDPIRVQDASSVSLSQNKFIGSNYRAVSATRVSDLKVDDNRVNGPTYIQMFWIDACALVSFTRNQWRGARAVSRIKASTDVTISGNVGVEPGTSQFGLVLEGLTRFNAFGNTFTTQITTASAIVLTGTANTQGRVGGNTCYGYTAASSGSGTNVAISENYV